MIGIGPAASAGSTRAGLWVRLGAALYEGLLATALVFITGFLMLPLVTPGTAASATDLSVPPLPARVILFCVLFSVVALYFVWSWTGGRRTLPLKTWRMRIAMPDGASPSRKTALLRYLAAWIGPSLALVAYVLLRPGGHGDLALGLAALNFIWAIGDPDRQFLHDRIAGTRIVRDGKAGS
ncbi:MAG TPA: RDD family protein [Casimicrobiaceae bacterium]|nr:RDD family protein [Casimicrobiaceae bacterium]